LFRCSQPLSNTQTPHPTTKAGQQHEPTPTRGRYHPRFPQQQGKEVTGLLSQSPIVCPVINRRPAPPKRRRPVGRHVCRAPEPHPLQARPIHRIAQHTEPPHSAGGSESRGAP